MKHTITNRTDTSLEVLITMDAEDLKPAVKQAYDELRPKVKAAGFRPGKAPDMIVARELGDGAIQHEVIEIAARQGYVKALNGEEVTVISAPELELKKFVAYTELEVTAKVDLLPPVALADYKNFKIKRPVAKADESKIEATIEDLRRAVASRKPVETPAKNDDEVNIDFDGTKDGQPISGASSQGYSLKLGSNSFIPGFEEKLIGAKKGETVDFDIVFPKDYHEDSLAGAKVHFKVKINSVTELGLPPIDAEFVGKVSPFATVEELKDDIRRRLVEESERAATTEFENMVLSELIEKSKYSVPEGLLKDQYRRLQGELEQNIGYQGLDLETYMKLSKKTQADLEADWKPEAEKRVALAMLLSEVARAEKLTVTPDEVEDELGKLREQYQDEKMQAEMAHGHFREDLYNHLLSLKTIHKIIDYVEAK